MMKYALLSIPLLLGACATTGGSGGGTSIPAIVTQVQAAAVQICKFEPTVQTVLDIVGLSVPGLSVAESIATAICSAVSAPGVAGPKAAMLKRGSTVFKVGPVVIHGRFLGK